ncbi:MAG: Secretion system C-terminal sorting domain, partial [Bacteroidota bacterium]
ASFGTPNWKYADCDGNGTINGTDTLAIIQNFSLTHPRLATEKHKSGLPPLSIHIQPSIFNASTQQLQATISLGNIALPMDSVYGITFGFNFDANYIDTSKITYSVLNSWLFANANDHFWLNHHQLQNGVMNFALVRNNQLGKAGFGDIMQINLPLSSSLTSQPDLSQFITSLSNVKVINQIGNEIAVSVVTDSSLYSVLLSANEISNKTNELTVYPSPAKQSIVISQQSLVYITITDVLGKAYSIPPFQRGLGGFELNISTLANGTYFIKATDTKGKVWNGKFVKE